MHDIAPNSAFNNFYIFTNLKVHLRPFLGHLTYFLPKKIYLNIFIRNLREIARIYNKNREPVDKCR